MRPFITLMRSKQASPDAALADWSITCRVVRQCSLMQCRANMLKSRD